MTRRTATALAAALALYAAGCGGGEEAAPEPDAAAPAATTAAPAATTSPPATTADPYAGLDNNERYCRHLADALGYESCADYQAGMAAQAEAAAAQREAEAEEVCGSWLDASLGATEAFRVEQKCRELGGEVPYDVFEPEAQAEPESGADTESEAGGEGGSVALAVQAPPTTAAVVYPYPDAPEGDFADEAPPTPVFPGPGLPAQVGATVERGDPGGSRILWPLAAAPPADIRARLDAVGNAEVGAGQAIVVGTVSTWRLPESHFGDPAAPPPADRRPEDWIVRRVVTNIDNEGSIARIWMCQVFPDWQRRGREARGARFGPSGGEMIFEQAYVGEDGLYYPTGGRGAEGVC